jgi:hypothetical protein
MIDDGDCGAIGGMKIGRETEVLGETLHERHFVHCRSVLDLTCLDMGFIVAM